MSLDLRKWRPRVESARRGGNGTNVDRLCDAALEEVTEHARGVLQSLVGEYRHFLRMTHRSGMCGAIEGRVRVRRDIERLCAAFEGRLKAVDFAAMEREIAEEQRPEPEPEPAVTAVRSQTGVRTRSVSRLAPEPVTDPAPEPAPEPDRASADADVDEGVAQDVAGHLGELLTPALRRELIVARAETTVTPRRRGRRVSAAATPTDHAERDPDARPAATPTDHEGTFAASALAERDPDARPRAAAPVAKPVSEPDPEEESPELLQEELLTDDDRTIAEFQTMLLRHGAPDSSDLDVYAEVLGMAEAQIFGPTLGLMAKRLPMLDGSSVILTLREFIHHLGILFASASGRRDYDAETCMSAMGILAKRAEACGISSEKLFRGRKSRMGWAAAGSADGAEDAEAALFNMLRIMLKTPDFWRLLGISLKKNLAEDMVEEDQAAGAESRASKAKNMEQIVKGLYIVLLKRLSARLHPRSIRKVAEVLHPQTVELEGLAKVLDKHELPPDIWRQQSGGLEGVRRGFQQGEQYVYVDTPPGSGKTRILLLAAQYLNPSGNSVLLVPNLNLVEQHRREAKRHGVNLGVGIVSPHDAVLDQPLTIMTYQQMLSYVQRGLFKPDRFNLLLLDEVHETLREARQGILTAFPKAKAIGATATGQDSIGRNVSEMFKCVYHISLADGLRAGICNPVRLHNIDLPEYDLSDSSAENDDLLLREKEIVRWYRKTCMGDQVLIIMSSNERAAAVAKYFKDQAVVKEAHAVYGGLPRNEIFSINERFQDGSIPVLVTAEYLVQGWDCSGLRNLVLGDPSEQEWQAAQRIGRAIRRVRPTETDSKVLQLRGGVVIKRRIGRGESLAHGEKTTALDRLFKIPAGFESGSRVVEPQPGFWPRNPFKVARG